MSDEELDQVVDAKRCGVRGIAESLEVLPGVRLALQLDHDEFPRFVERENVGAVLCLIETRELGRNHEKSLTEQIRLGRNPTLVC
jgi:hypothetical protein